MIEELLKSILNDLLISFNRLRATLHEATTLITFKIVKYRAFRLHKKHNCMVLVVKIGGGVKIITKYQFKKMRQDGIFPKEFDGEDLRKIALYITPKYYDKKRV